MRSIAALIWLVWHVADFTDDDYEHDREQSDAD